MAYNFIERLISDDLSFISDLSIYDQEHLITSVRLNPKRKEIASNLINNGNNPYLTYKIIYDDECFIDKTIELMDKYPWLFLEDEKMFKNFLFSSFKAYQYIIKHLDDYLVKDSEHYIPILTHYLLCHNYSPDVLSKHANLHYRAIFILTIIKKYPHLLKKIYPNLINYLYGYNYGIGEQISLLPDIMAEDDVSSIILALLERKGPIKLYDDLKTFLYTNYKENDLGKKLFNANSKKAERALEGDLNHLFTTSKTYQINLMSYYRDKLASEIVAEFDQTFHLFLGNKAGDYGFIRTIKIFENGLSSTLKKYIDTYLDLSVDKTCEKINYGSTADCYRIGDYVIKIIKMKWSYEDLICPRSYLIAKNFEEVYIRNSNGHVIAGLEVQKYLKRKAIDVNRDTLVLYEQALAKAGYYLNDTLINGPCGDNGFFLDSYKEADACNPECLPDWFKENPLVLIDHDRIYKLENKFPKQLIGYH